jgi:hypothetical protein
MGAASLIRRRQKAEGRGQKAEGRRQRAEGKGFSYLWEQEVESNTEILMNLLLWERPLFLIQVDDFCHNS